MYIGDFFARLLQGGYTAPPLKTRFCRGFGHPNHATAEFRKEVRKSPAKDGPAGGVPDFFSKIGDNMVWGGETFLKIWSKRGYPSRGALRGPPQLVPL